MNHLPQSLGNSAEERTAQALVPTACAVRQPTPRAEVYRWHTAALKGGDRVTNDDPHAGWFKRRLVKGGPFIPARIWLEQDVCQDTGELLSDEKLLCEVNGARADPVEQWAYLAGHPISEAEFRYLEALRQHCAWYEPDHPASNPRVPINHLTTPIQF